MSEEEPVNPVPDAPVGPSPDSSKEVGELQTFYMPIYVLTAVFGAIFIIGPLAVHRCQNKGIIRTCIMLTAFSMWLLWVTVYIAQMNPLIGPRLSNRSLAWVAYTWGDPASKPESDVKEEEPNEPE